MKKGGLCALTRHFVTAVLLSEGKELRSPLPVTLTQQAGVLFTSEDGELGMDGDLPVRVLSNTLVNVFIPGSPEGLDPQNSTCAFIEFNCLGDKKRHTHSKYP